MTFKNPLVSNGGDLAFTSVHSPNFVHGSAGWSINKDGSAEFNSLDVRGMITIENASEGVFVYSGTPALGNLIASIASTNGTDAYGNKYPQGVATENHSGFTSRGDNSESNYLIMTVPSPNNDPIFLYNHDNTAFADGFVQSIKDGTSPYSGKLTLLTTAPTGKNANSIEMFSQLSDSSKGPNTKMHSDVTIDGILTAGNIAFGAVNITPSAANTPTSANISYGPLQGTTFRGLVTARTTVPGTTVTGTAITGETSTGATVWVTRTNTTQTTVNWFVIGS